MRFIKKFEKFLESSADPMVKPAKPSVKPDVKPGRPQVRPSRPSPIPSKDPSTTPSPAKAKKSTADKVAERFIDLMMEKGEDIKKYTELYEGLR
jgi:hypothetical protein